MSKEAKQQIEKLEADLAEEKKNHHAPSRWPDCPVCKEHYTDDLAAAEQNAYLEAKLATALEQKAGFENAYMGEIEQHHLTRIALEADLARITEERDTLKLVKKALELALREAERDAYKK